MTHTHYTDDSISVCDQCAVDLRMVGRLREAGITKWGQVTEFYANGELFQLSGIGEKSALILMDVKIERPKPH